MWTKLFMSVLSFLYLGIIPFPIYPEYLQYVVVVALLAAVVIPISDMLEAEFMEGNDDDEIGPREPYQQPTKTIEVK